MPLFLFFLIIPILEILIFIKISSVFGVSVTIFLIILTALIGSITVKKQGFEILTEFRNGIQNPLILLSNGIMILIAGILLLTPGVLTDSVGILLLVPGFRKKIIQIVSKKING